MNQVQTQKEEQIKDITKPLFKDTVYGVTVMPNTKNDAITVSIMYRRFANNMNGLAYLKEVQRNSDLMLALASQLGVKTHEVYITMKDNEITFRFTF